MNNRIKILLAIISILWVCTNVGAQTITAQKTVAAGNTIYNNGLRYTYCIASTAATTAIVKKVDSSNNTQQDKSKLNIQQIKAYPNPFTSYIVLTVENLQQTPEIWLIDVVGKKLYPQYNCQDNGQFLQIKIQTEDIKSGRYIAVVKQNNIISTIQIVKP